MKPDIPAHIQSTIDSICELGCERVNEIIAALECGHEVKETSELDEYARQRVLEELKEIMAIYENDQV